jgi:hypothetical protein
MNATNDLSLMERVALTRLRRFERVATVAETAESPIWQRLARQSARLAYRDLLLAASARQSYATLVDGSAEAA